jgi:hypothetical protein
MNRPITRLGSRASSGPVRRRPYPRNGDRALIIHVIAPLLIATQVCAGQFVVEYKPPTPPFIGAGLSIAVDDNGNPHLAYNRGIDFNGAYRHAYKQGGTWRYNTIEDRSGVHSSLGFSNGFLYGSYQDPILADARFASYNGSNWTTELVSDIFPVEGQYTSLAFDQAGGPHIAYYEGSGADNAIHAFRFGGGWLGEAAAGFGTNERQGLYTSIALTAEDTIFISHVGVGALGVNRARLTELSGPEWQTVDISPTIIAGGSATAVVATSTGQPIVAFMGGALYVADRLTFSTWAITPVDTLTFEDSDLEMRLDSQGQPHVAYQKGLALRHAYRDGAGVWHKETIDAPTLGIGALDLAIDGSDVLHIGYLVRDAHPATTTTPVHYARGTFGNWTIEPVEGLEHEGSFLALTTTAAGEAVVAFYDASLGDVQVSRRVGSNNWSEDDVAEVGDVGRFVSMPQRTVAASSANVAYFNATNGTLYRRSGTYDSWSETFIAFVPALAGLSYADSAGFGRVAYYDSSAGDLFLARLGPGATSIVPVDQIGDVGRSCKVGITTDGVTHIVYHDATVGRLRHARFAGGAWLFQNIATGPSIGRTCAMATRQAGTGVGVAYYDPPNGDLYWARWAGSTWLTGLVDATNDVGSACSVVIGAGNNIGIAYYDATVAELKFALVTVLGTVTAMEIVDTGNVGRPNAIALDPTSNLVTIVYYDATLKQIKCARQQFSGGVGVEDVSYFGTELVVAPSPARVNERIRVAYAGGVRRMRSVALYDVRGRELGKTAFVAPGAGAVELQVPPGSSGILFIRAVGDNGLVSIGRIVVLK